MKQATTLFVRLSLAFVVLFPVAATADDKEDLEATMEVLDAPSGVDDAMRRLEVPDDSGVADEAPGDADDAEADAEPDDGFLHDDIHDDDALEDEDDFEEAEDIDDDAFDE